MKKYILAAVLGFSLLSAISTVSAQNADADPLKAPVKSCGSLSYDMSVTSRDAETSNQVSSLQFFLQTKRYLNIEPTGYFGLMTAAAVKEYQIKNNITPASGFVGTITRKSINAAGCAISASSPQSNNGTTVVTATTSPFITLLSPNGGENMIAGNSYPLKLVLSSDKAYAVSYYLVPQKGTALREGDGTYYDKKAGGYAIGGISYNTSVSSIDTDMSIPRDIPTGTYKLRAYLRKAKDTKGSPTIKKAIAYDDSDTSFNLTGLATVNGPLKVSSPKSGESLEESSTYKISWNGEEGKRYMILLEDENGYGQGTIASSVKGKSYSWEVGKAYVESDRGKVSSTVFSDKKYRIRVVNLSTGVANSDVPSGTFTIEKDYMPHIGMVRGMATDNFEVDSGLKAAIEGKNLIYAGKDTTVWVNGVAAEVTQYNDKVVYFIVPQLSNGTYDLYLSTSYGTSNTVTISVINGIPAI